MSSTSTSSSSSTSTSTDWWCGGSRQVKWLTDVVEGGKSNDWLMQWYGNALCLALALALSLVLALALVLEIWATWWNFHYLIFCYVVSAGSSSQLVLILTLIFGWTLSVQDVSLISFGRKFCNLFLDQFGFEYCFWYMFCFWLDLPVLGQ